MAGKYDIKFMRYITLVYRIFFNISGCPAITIPVKLSGNKMPISIQIMASNFDDIRLLQFANWLEKKLQFSHVNL